MMAPRHTLEVYGKPGCHLCEAVLQTAMRVQRRHPFELKLRNILGDAADRYEQYKDLIPVVLLDGREIARFRLSEAELIARLSHYPPPGEA